MFFLAHFVGFVGDPSPLVFCLVCQFLQYAHLLFQDSFKLGYGDFVADNLVVLIGEDFADGGHVDIGLFAGRGKQLFQVP